MDWISKDCQRLCRAWRCSRAGLAKTWSTEQAFRQEIYVLFLLAAPGALLLGRTGVERALMLGSWLLVIIVELLNSAIEATVDRISHQHHELSGIAKDCGSAAVLVALLLSIVTWTLILSAHCSRYWR